MSWCGITKARTCLFVWFFPRIPRCRPTWHVIAETCRDQPHTCLPFLHKSQHCPDMYNDGCVRVSPFWHETAIVFRPFVIFHCSSLFGASYVWPIWHVTCHLSHVMSFCSARLWLPCLLFCTSYTLCHYVRLICELRYKCFVCLVLQVPICGCISSYFMYSIIWQHTSVVNCSSITSFIFCVTISQFARVPLHLILRHTGHIRAQSDTKMHFFLMSWKFGCY